MCRGRRAARREAAFGRGGFGCGSRERGFGGGRRGCCGGRGNHGQVDAAYDQQQQAFNAGVQYASEPQYNQGQQYGTGPQYEVQPNYAPNPVREQRRPRLLGMIFCSRKGQNQPQAQQDYGPQTTGAAAQYYEPQTQAQQYRDAPRDEEVQDLADEKKASKLGARGERPARDSVAPPRYSTIN